MAVLREVWANYRDESFISSVPQPATDATDANVYAGQPDDGPHKGRGHTRCRGYRRVRRELARQYDVGSDPTLK